MFMSELQENQSSKKFMDTEVPVVSGALSLVLRISRIAGIAPLRLVAVRDGYSATASKPYAKYSLVIITLMNIAGIVGLFLDFQNQSVRVKKPSILTLWIPDLLSTIILAGIGSYNGIKRMQNLIHSLNSLEKIKTRTNIREKNTSKKRERNRGIFVVLFLVFNTFLLAMDFLSNLLSHRNDYLIVFLYGIFYLEYNMVLLMEMQVVLLAFEVDSTLKIMNKKLVIILEDAKLGISQRIIKNGIRNLTRSYAATCATVMKISNKDGFIMLLMFTSFVLYLIITGYNFTSATYIPYGTPSRIFDILLQIVWTIYHMSKMLLFVEPYYRIKKEVDKIQDTLSNLMHIMTDIGSQVPVELELMSRQLIMNAPVYSPLGMFTLQRSLITTTLNVVTTYLVFMIQFRLEEEG